MKNTNSLAKINNSTSLAALRTAHIDLLKRQRQLGNSSEFLDEVKNFIRVRRVTGVYLDSSDDRWAAQSLLDYWATVLHRADYDLPDTTLAEFDLTKAPELDDKLCPYLGLDAFQEKDQEKFFGRKRFIDELVEKLMKVHLLAVAGLSGSGKSSLVRAGLLPKLKSDDLPGNENWDYYTPIVPGSNPLENLARLLHPPQINRDEWIKKQVKAFKNNSNHLSKLVTESVPGVSSVFIIDQFEEIFTLCSDDLRQAFINNLVELIKMPGYRHIVILTIRTDFVDYLAQLPTFPPLSEQNKVLLTTLHPDELREAIEKPAKSIGLKFEDGVVDALITDVLGEPAALPLLQFALLELWNNRERNRISMEAYNRLGGAHKALENSAEALYNGLIREDRTVAKQILLKLSWTLEEGQEVTRDRIRLKDLIYQPGVARVRVEQVLNKLVDTHLVRRTEGETEDDTQVEIAHEALVRNWPRLVEWLKEEQEIRRRRLRLRVAAENWAKTGKHPGELWREGIRFKEAEKYEDLNEVEVEFLLASREAIEAEEEQKHALREAQIKAEFERERAETERKYAEELEIAHDKAIRERDRAEQQRRLSFSRELAAAAINNLNIDPERSILLALCAVSVTHSENEPITPEAEDALHRAVQTSRVRLALAGHTARVWGITFSPDGTRIATASEDKTVKIWDIKSQEILHNLRGHREGVLDVAFSPDGKRLATASQDNTVRVWDVESGQQEMILSSHEHWITSVSFSPDGRNLATTSGDTKVRVWDAESGEEMLVLSDHTDWINRVTFSSDGTRLATASRDKTVKIWDVESGEMLYSLPGRAEIIDVAFSPDGTRLVTTSLEDWWVVVWNIEKPRKILFRLSGHTSWVESVTFSPDGTRLATGSKDGTAKVWDAETGQEMFTLSGHTDRVTDVTFNPQGTYLATASWDGLAKVWDITASQGVLTLPDHTKAVIDVAFSPDGTCLATASYDRTAKLWDAKTGQVLRSFDDHTDEVIDVDFSPDGTLLATASSDKTAKVWDINSGKLLHTLHGHIKKVFDVAFSPDGMRLASASFDKTVKVWDVASGKELYTLPDTNMVYGVTFSPDGKLIATACEDRTVKIWDATSGQMLFPLRGHIGRVRSVAFSPDGTYLATSSEDKTIKVWNVTQGQAPYTLSLTGHNEEVIDVAFSPDGKRLATACADKTAKVWEVATGQEKLTLLGHTDRVTGLAFSPNGRRLATASEDGTVRVYTLDIEKLMALARKRVTRSLTPEECQKYLHQEACLPIVASIGNSSAMALWLVVKGNYLAKGGDPTGAITLYQEALELDPTLDFDPEAEVGRLAPQLRHQL